jgi:glutamine synthetase
VSVIDHVPPARSTTVEPVADVIRAVVQNGSLREIEVAWPDHSGHVLGKRIPAAGFLERAPGGFPFCDAALTWSITGECQEGARLTDWQTGYPDMIAVPRLSTFSWLPWREGAGQVLADLVDHRGELVRTAPRTVLRRVTDRLAGIGLTAQVGVELEFYLLRPDGSPLAEAIHCYSLQKSNDLDPAFGAIVDAVGRFVAVEGSNSEYGPGQLEINLAHAGPLEAADQGMRLKYAVRELARRAGMLATFMAKPLTGESGSSMHLHLSLWRDGEPVFAPAAAAENPLMRHAIGGVLRHLPGITVYGAPTVNSAKRYQEHSFAPTSASWGGDNRTAAVRSLIESPAATRLELRTGGADANPYWAVAALLAAAVAGVEDEVEPPARGVGNLYGAGGPLPATLAEAVSAARADARIGEILGADAVHDMTTVAYAEWRAYISEVTAWERDRYLRLA